ncbi:MAG: IS66 family insertion sequence element accessory protein TnpB [Planctomycetota bacterium]|nr:IS66 family insertion sequence element accessory protein TnpB [Planctomycetota bacterium]
MLSLSTRVRIFAATEPIDFRKGFDGLVQIVRDGFGEDPFAGDLFCFFNRRRDRVKVLVWDRNGFWLHYKRLERGTFERIEGGSKRIELDRARMAMLLEGIDTKSTRFRRCFARDVRIGDRDDRRDRTSATE